VPGQEHCAARRDRDLPSSKKRPENGSQPANAPPRQRKGARNCEKAMGDRNNRTEQKKILTTQIEQATAQNNSFMGGRGNYSRGGVLTEPFDGPHLSRRDLTQSDRGSFAKNAETFSSLEVFQGFSRPTTAFYRPSSSTPVRRRPDGRIARYYCAWTRNGQLVVCLMPATNFAWW